MLSLIEKNIYFEPMKCKSINIVKFFKISNFIFSLYRASLLHTDHLYILSVCSLFINLKPHQSWPPFRPGFLELKVFQSVSKLHNSLFSMWYLFYKLLVLMYLYLVFQCSFLSFHLCFLLSACLIFVELVSEFTLWRDWKSREQTCERKCLWWQFRSW